MRHVWIVAVTMLAAPVGFAHQTYDVVTMKNGDYYVGTVAHPSFSLITDFGRVTIPYGLMAQLRVGAMGDGSDVIIAHTGERYIGSLEHGELIVLRTTHPTLPVHSEDVGEVDFSKKGIDFIPNPIPDQVELTNGMRLLGQVTNSEFLILNEEGMHSLDRRDIYVLVVETPEGDDKSYAQVMRYPHGQPLSGGLLNRTLGMITQYGTALEMPASAVDTIALSVHAPGTTNRWLAGRRYHSRINPAYIIRDSLRGDRRVPELVLLRGGPFQRGDRSGNGDGDEKPPQEVVLAPFAIGVYEVTFDEYDDYCEATQTEEPDDQGWGRGDRPVINVSWLEAQAYTQWLSEQTGEIYRLPTDAEWEYAARAGSDTLYWWGDSAGMANANCDGCGSLWGGEKSARVGKFPPNPFGLHDTGGNVWEWVEDCFLDTFANAPADGGPLRTKGCGKRVIRGGAWSFLPREMRNANRWRDFPSRHSDDTGFRVVREVRW